MREAVAAKIVKVSHIEGRECCRHPDQTYQWSYFQKAPQVNIDYALETLQSCSLRGVSEGIQATHYNAPSPIYIRLGTMENIYSQQVGNLIHIIEMTEMTGMTGMTEMTDCQKMTMTFLQ